MEKTEKLSKKYLENLASHPRFGLMPLSRRMEIGRALASTQPQAESTVSGEETTGLDVRQSVKYGGVDAWKRRYYTQLPDGTWVKKAELKQALRGADDESRIRILEGEKAWQERYGMKIGDEWVSKKWYESLTDEDKTELSTSGLKPFTEKHYIQLGDNTVRKEWFEGLTQDEQDELKQYGLNWEGYKNFVKVGPKQELIARSLLQKMVSPELSKFLLNKYIMSKEAASNMPTEDEIKFVRNAISALKGSNKGLTSPETQKFLNENREVIYRVLLSTLPCYLRVLELVEKYKPEGSDEFYSELDTFFGYTLQSSLRRPPKSLDEIMRTGTEALEKDKGWRDGLLSTAMGEIEKSGLSEGYESFMEKYGLVLMGTQFIEEDFIKKHGISREASVLVPEVLYAAYGPTIPILHMKTAIGSGEKSDYTKIRLSLPGQPRIPMVSPIKGKEDVHKFIMDNPNGFWIGFVKMAGKKGQEWLDEIGYPRGKDFVDIEKWAYGRNGFVWRNPNMAREIINTYISGTTMGSLYPSRFLLKYKEESAKKIPRDMVVEVNVTPRETKLKRLFPRFRRIGDIGATALRQ